MGRQTIPEADTRCKTENKVAMRFTRRAAGAFLALERE
jgi:hypothetical protein